MCDTHVTIAFVIGTVSTEEKAKIARDLGADEVILYSQVDFAEETLKITKGKGVNVIYDSVGTATFDKVEISQNFQNIYFIGIRLPRTTRNYGIMWKCQW